MAENDCRIFGTLTAPVRVLRLTGEHERDGLAGEYDMLCRRAPAREHCLIGLSVHDWNRELSPWEADAVWGSTPFGGGAAETLSRIGHDILPMLAPHDGKTIVCGYSLAGLFALWAVCITDAFDGAAAVSPSVWFPGWTDFAAAHIFRCDAVYLSLGKKEEKVRHPILSTVGDAIRTQYALLCEKGVRCTLDWNEGNHFADCSARTVGGMLWCEQLLCTP